MALNDKLPDSIRRRLPGEKAVRQAEEAAAAPTVSHTDLRKRRDVLAEQFAEGQYDLGGLVYEMAIRDHYRLDIITDRAASLQRVDTELAEAERLLKLEDAAAAGACRFCGSLHARGATFCWQCGERLLELGTPEAQTGELPSGNGSSIPAATTSQFGDGPSAPGSWQPGR